LWRAGEESNSNRLGLGGVMVALDVRDKALHIVPAAGHASYENATPLDNHGSNKVVLLIGDDSVRAALIHVYEKRALQ
jgi:hypothetical protein